MIKKCGRFFSEWAEDLKNEKGLWSVVCLLTKKEYRNTALVRSKSKLKPASIRDKCGDCQRNCGVRVTRWVPASTSRKRGL